MDIDMSNSNTNDNSGCGVVLVLACGLFGGVLILGCIAELTAEFNGLRIHECAELGVRIGRHIALCVGVPQKPLPEILVVGHRNRHWTDRPAVGTERR